MSVANGRGSRRRGRGSSSPGYGRRGSATTRCLRPTSPSSQCSATSYESGGRPRHDRDRADAVLWAALDQPVAVGDVDQHIALAVEEADHLQSLEDEAAPLVEDTLAVRDLAADLDRTDLTAGDAGIAGVLGNAQRPLHAAGLRSADVTGDTFDLGSSNPSTTILSLGPSSRNLVLT